MPTNSTKSPPRATKPRNESSKTLPRPASEPAPTLKAERIQLRGDNHERPAPLSSGCRSKAA